MFKNYLLFTLRNIKKYKGYFFIKVLGLALGMACCILMFLWVQHELSFDGFHENRENIYRVISVKDRAGEPFHSIRNANPLGPSLKDEYPEVENFTRVVFLPPWGIKYKGKMFENDRIGVADPSFFEMFTFHAVKGDLKDALKDPNSIVISETMAKKFFGDEEPIGKEVSIDPIPFKVVAVIKDVPAYSHMNFDCIFPLETIGRFIRMRFEDWKIDNRFFLYVQLRENSSGEAVSRKIAGTVKKHLPESKTSIYLQPLNEIHLYSNLQDDTDNYHQGNISYVYIFSLIGLCILAIAVINFTNLSTAHSMIRSKEVAIKKVVGAQKKDIIKQFLGESFFLTFIGLLFALILVYLFLPVFNVLTNRPLTLFMDISGSLQFLAGLIFISLLTGVVSGSYPALYLSSFQPANIFKRIDRVGKPRGTSLQKVLVVIQFAASIVFMISTIVVYSQIKFVTTRDLGFDKENILYFFGGPAFSQNYEAKRRELMENPNVLNVTQVGAPVNLNFTTENVNWEGKAPGETVSVYPVSVDYEYFNTYNIKMAEGRYFSREFSTDTSNYLLNETAVRAMGLNSPIGKRFELNGQQGIIIGVVEDYHHASLHNAVSPLVFKLFYEPQGFVSVKIKPGDLPETMSFLKGKVEKFLNGMFPFSYSFLDDTINGFYENERRVGRIFGYSTMIMIFISCLGIMGLVSYVTQRKTKEIGIRKVYGASTAEIVPFLAKQFLAWVLTAIVLAYPIAWYFMNKWLQNYSYRTSMGFWIFLSAGVIMMVFVLLTVSYQTIKAARANPAKSLRYE